MPGYYDLKIYTSRILVVFHSTDVVELKSLFSIYCRTNAITIRMEISNICAGRPVVQLGSKKVFIDTFQCCPRRVCLRAARYNPLQTSFYRFFRCWKGTMIRTEIEIIQKELTVLVTLLAYFLEGTFMVKELLKSDECQADAEVFASVARNTNA